MRRGSTDKGRAELCAALGRVPLQPYDKNGQAARPYSRYRYLPRTQFANLLCM